MPATWPAEATNAAITASLLRLAAQCEATARQARDMAGQASVGDVPVSQPATDLLAIAVQAAAKVQAQYFSHEPEPDAEDLHLARMMLEAARPHLAAAERERLRGVLHKFREVIQSAMIEYPFDGVAWTNVLAALGSPLLAGHDGGSGA